MLERELIARRVLGRGLGPPAAGCRQSLCRLCVSGKLDTNCGIFSSLENHNREKQRKRSPIRARRASVTSSEKPSSTFGDEIPGGVERGGPEPAGLYDIDEDDDGVIQCVVLHVTVACAWACALILVFVCARARVVCVAYASICPCVRAICYY